ncbi:transporter, major facilitator family protein [Opisthorchis viverrini]|uniref:Transporter, major facilitator family protein n=1 Tax=Opisthorchis viverrini TaxID=6198 RepID=A0A1S8WJX1_OPIVI|nr:transporter, major facilitator family protein [Opisthorchis viverrini]
MQNDRSLTFPSSQLAGQRLDTFWTGSEKKWIGVVASLIEIFFFGAFFYGINSLIPAYTDIGVFEQFCNGTDCSRQNVMFSYAYILGLFCQMFFSPLTGLLMDRIGLRVAKLVAVSIYTTGSLMFAFTNGNTSFLLFPAVVFVAIGSLANLFCNFFISNWFPKQNGLLLSLQNGAFDSSAAIAFFISQTVPQISLQTSFILIGVISAVYGTLMGLLFLKQYGSDMDLPPPEIVEESLVEDEIKENGTLAIENVDMEVTRVIRRRYPNLKSCFLSSPYALIMFYSPAGNLRYSYYNSSLSKQLNRSFGNDKQTVDELLEAFSAVALFAFFVAPVNGLIFDASRKYFQRKLARQLQDSKQKPPDEEIYWTHMRAMYPVLLITATLTLLMTITQFFPGHRALFYIQFVIGISFQTMSASLKATNVMLGFPVEHFGTLMGVSCLCSAFMALIQIGLLQAPLNVADGIMLLISVMLYIPPLFYIFKKR